MVYKIEFSLDAEIDSDETCEYYENKAPGLSFRFLDDLNAAMSSIKNNPFSFHVSDFTVNIMRCNLTVFPYAAYYTILESNVIILAIVSQGRSKSYIRRRLK
jgi:plasmid stabilization system protein ParE